MIFQHRDTEIQSTVHKCLQSVRSWTAVLLLILLMSPSVAIVQAATLVNGIYYNLEKSAKTAEVTSNPNKYTGSVSIPSTVSYGGVSYSVTSIGEKAFWSCNQLKSVTIPNSVITICDDAFEYCHGLTSINIPNGVTSIGKYAFWNCNGLTSITISKSVKTMSYNSFAFCHGVSSIKVDSANPYYDSRNNCNAIIETSSNKLVVGCKNTDIPNSVTTIGEYAFCCNFSQTALTIPSNVKTIETFAFSSTNLTSVTIHKEVTRIGSNPFENCYKLTSVKVETGNPNYDSRNNCNAIIETSSNTLITGCKNTVIPNSVTSIGYCAFYYCRDLKSIAIPNSVANLGPSAFGGCESLTSIKIPVNVTALNYGVFAYCSKLTSIAIPRGVTYIRDYAFKDCSSLISVTAGNPVPVEIGQNTFTNRTNATLTVPKGSKSAYQTADYWKEFKQIIEKDMGYDAGPGDVNGDGEINIVDVSMLVDYLLERNSSSIILANAEVNKDGTISVSDVVSIVQLIMKQDGTNIFLSSLPFLWDESHSNGYGNDCNGSLTQDQDQSDWDCTDKVYYSPDGIRSICPVFK